MIRLAVIGDPIEHSLSPAVHGAAMSAMGIELEYQKIHVTSDALKSFTESARTSLNGFNLTMPHKINVIPYLDYQDEDALFYGAVNTVSVRNGKLYGSNTDGIGLAAALKRIGSDFEGKRVTVLGAGGAANAVLAAAFKNNSSKINVACRTRGKAEEILNRLKTKSAYSADLCNRKNAALSVETEVFGFDAENLSKACDGADILINTTPLGMQGIPNNFDSFDFLDALPSKAVVSDLIYKPMTTELLNRAKKRGHTVQCGLDMLIFQALAAEERFLNKRIDMQSLYVKVYEEVSKML